MLKNTSVLIIILLTVLCIQAHKPVINVISDTINVSSETESLENFAKKLEQATVDTVVLPTVKEKETKTYTDIEKFQSTETGTLDLIEKLKKQAKEEEQNKQYEKAYKTLYEVGVLYANKKEFSNAKNAHDKAVVLIAKLKNNLNYADFCYELGGFYKNLEKYNYSLSYYEKSLKKLKTIDSAKEKYINTSIITANMFSQVGLNPKALDLYKENLLFSKEIDDKPSVVKCYNGIGEIYNSLKEYDKALENYTSAKDISEKSNIDESLADIYNNISSTYVELGDLINAEQMAIMASNILKSKNDEKGASSNYNILGDIATQAQNYNKAENYYIESYNIASKINFNKQLSETLTDKGNLHIKKSQINLAIESCLRAYKIAKEGEFKKELYKSCECLSTAYKLAENTVKSYVYFEEYSALESELFSTDKAKEIGKIESKYEYQIESQDSDFKIQALERKSKLQQLAFFALLLLGFAGLCMLVYIYRQFKNKQHNHEVQLKLNRRLKKANKQHEKLNNELSEANQKKQQLNIKLKTINTELENLNEVYNQVNSLLQENHDKLEAANSSLSNFASVAAHDLKAPLRSISSFSNLLLKKNRPTLDETDKEYFEFITDNTVRLQKMIDSLLTFSKIDKNLPPPTEIPLANVVKNVEDNLKSLITETNAEIVYKNLPTIIAHQPLLEQLVQNIMNNAIKFSKPNEKPVVTIMAKKNMFDKMLHISIADNGIGIEQKNVDRAFELFARFNKKSEYEGSGIGLSTCKKIVDYYGGNIWLESKVGVGTTVHFTFKTH